MASQTSVIPASHADILDSKALAHVATVGPDREPQKSPYRYLETRGTVEHIDPDPDKAFINSMAKKYLGQDVYPWHQPGEERVVVVVRPEHTTQMG